MSTPTARLARTLYARLGPPAAMAARLHGSVVFRLRRVQDLRHQIGTSPTNGSLETAERETMNHALKYSAAEVELLKNILGLYPRGNVTEAVAEWCAMTGKNCSPNSAKETCRRHFGRPPSDFMVQTPTSTERAALLAEGARRLKNALAKSRVKVSSREHPGHEWVAPKPAPKNDEVYAGDPATDVETIVRTVITALRTGKSMPVKQVEPEPMPEPDEDGDADAGHPEEIEKLLKIVGSVKKGHHTSLEAICDKLDMSPARGRQLVEEANAKGFRVVLEGQFVGQAPPPDPAVETIIKMPAPVAHKHLIALIGDPHIGSKHHMKGEFLDFIGNAYERGVRTFPCVGDLLDGVYSFSIYEQSHRGFEEQVQAAIEELPRLEGAYWPWILGNHDETFESKSGMSVISAANAMFRDAGRTDVECVGSRGKILRLKAPGEKRGVSLELWHPKKGAGYALTYAMQNHIRDYPVGRKPDILAVGHWHTAAYFNSRGVHAFACGCWQGGGSSFGKSLGGAPAIGSWIVEYSLTEAGTVREVNPSWRSYYEYEDEHLVQVT